MYRFLVNDKCLITIYFILLLLRDNLCFITIITSIILVIIPNNNYNKLSNKRENFYFKPKKDK